MIRAFAVVGSDDLRARVGWRDLVEPVRQVLADYSLGRAESPIVVLGAGGSAGDVHVKAAWVAGRPVYTVKVASWFPARAAEGSAASGYIAVHDARTGDLLAILQDEHHLTDARTAAAGAVATQLLARPDASVLAVLGTGTQAYLQTLATCELVGIGSVVLWGRRAPAVAALRDALRSAAPHLVVGAAADPRAAVLAADVVVTATSSREPILLGEWLRPGQHVTAVGADDLTKAELDPACFHRADLLVVDSLEETPRFAGDLSRALASPAAGQVGADAELGELVLGRHPGRRDARQITVAKLIGLGVEDLAAAEVALRAFNR